jgi:hypothetical protein
LLVRPVSQPAVRNRPAAAAIRAIREKERCISFPHSLLLRCSGHRNSILTFFNRRVWCHGARYRIHQT